MHIKDDDSIAKIQRIRKSIFADILQYNKEAAETRKIHDRTNRQKQLQQFCEMNKKQQQSIHQIEENKRRSMHMQKDQLKKQYDRQINQRKFKQQQQKQHEKIYADLGVSYQRYQNQRRLYDLEKMYNQKKYKARIVQNQPRRFKTEMDHGECSDYRNPETAGSKRKVTFVNQEKNGNENGNVIKQNKLNYQSKKRHHYQDSLDNIKFRDNLEYCTPKGRSKQEDYDSMHY